MTENEVAQIIKILDRIENEQARQRILLIGNGDNQAILPRLQTLEMFVRGLKLLLPIVTALIIAGIMFAVFGSP
jgi:hypothetical protein